MSSILVGILDLSPVYAYIALWVGKTKYSMIGKAADD